VENALSQPSFADIYERVLVPGIFDRYARDLIERARPIGPSARALDLGCGTGIVARLLRERLGGAARVTGLDANPQMLATARAIAPEIAWVEGNAVALPFDDAAFELVFCQEMLQFAPDRAAAVREMRRVLAPGGHLHLSTWRARRENPLHEALGVVAERHLGASNDRRYALGDGEALRALLVDGGFTDVRVETVTLTDRFATYPVRMSALAAGFDLSGLSDDERERRLAAVDADSAPVLARFTTDGFIVAPSSANVASAHVPVQPGH
jgi:ubiquinone/menaquinone biosynthesis C-methylase UbiE